MPKLNDDFENHGRRGLGQRNATKLMQFLAWDDPFTTRSFRLFEDFCARPGAALPTWLTTQDTSAAGAPTLDFAADAACGAYVLQLAADTEVEKITLYGGDNHLIDITKKPYFAARVKISPDVTGAGGTLAASDKIVIGLANDRNATLDSIAINAWFLLAGANLNIYVETDDGTTDTDDKDTGIDYVDGTYLTLEIDCSNLSDIRFLINGVDVTPQTMSLAAATGNVSPFIEVQKASAANKDHKVTIDWLVIENAR